MESHVKIEQIVAICKVMPLHFIDSFSTFIYLHALYSPLAQAHHL